MNEGEEEEEEEKTTTQEKELEKKKILGGIEPENFTWEDHYFNHQAIVFQVLFFFF